MTKLDWCCGSQYLTLCISLVVQQLLSQQKDTDQEESKKLNSEREAHLKRIQQLTEETGKLKNEVARSVCSLIRL